MCTFFMPLSKCSTFFETSPSKQEVKVEEKITYAYSAYTKYSLEYVLSIVAFFWPTLILIFTTINGKLLSKVSLNIVEISLCLLSGFFLFGLTYFGEILYGGYIAIVSVVIYLSASVFQVVKKFRLPKVINDT